MASVNPFRNNIVESRIRNTALELSHKYEEEYKEYCRENPGYIMHGATMKAEVLSKASFATSLHDLQCMKRCFEIEAKAMQARGMINGFTFNVQAIQELIDKLNK